MIKMFLKSSAAAITPNRRSRIGIACVWLASLTLARCSSGSIENQDQEQLDGADSSTYEPGDGGNDSSGDLAADSDAAGTDHDGGNADDGAQSIPCNCIASIWAVHDGAAVEKDDLDNPNKSGNSAWNGIRVKIFGGRNEVIAFQLLVQAQASGINALTVSLPELRQRSGSAVIRYQAPDADPTQYTGRPISIFTEHYMNIIQESNCDNVQFAKPADMTGWKPVALVPENATAGLGGFPIQVPPNNNQGIWFDLYLAKDLPAGFYDGTIFVYADGEIRQVPIELELFSFTLPDEKSMTMLFWFDRAQATARHFGVDPLDAYMRFAQRNRVEFAYASDLTVDKANAKIGFWNGSFFSSANGYEGPGTNTGFKIIPRTFYGPQDFKKDQGSAQSLATEWMNFLATTLPGKTTFVYLPDEPSVSDSAAITVCQNVGNWIHGSSGAGKNLPTFVAASISGSNQTLMNTLGDSVDIWTVQAGDFTDAKANTERAHGDEMWYYNYRRPYIGALLYDVPPTDARVHAWACFKHGIGVYYSWNVNHWTEGGNKTNVWVDPKTYFCSSGDPDNGDGVLVFPGEDNNFDDQNRGIKGPVSTIGLANLRRGVQDHLYLTMARQQGATSLVNQSLQAIVPQVLGGTTAVTFPQDGGAYETVRYQLAQSLSGK